MPYIVAPIFGADEDKKEALIETGKIAEAAFNRRTEEMKQKTDETNSKLEEFIRTYREKLNEVNGENKENNTEQ